MSQRKVLKEIIQFGRREFKEKKPLFVEILRVKSKTILTRGVLPSLSVKQVKGAKYLVVADYKEFFRVYPFTTSGVLLGGQNLEKTVKLLKTLKKGTIKEYTLPKKMPKLRLGDISVFYREQFNKARQSLNDVFGLNIKYPFSITAVNNLEGDNTEELIAQKDGGVLKIDAKYHKAPEFGIITHRELVYYYLINTGIFPKEKYLKEFCYFIIMILLRGERAKKVLKLLLKCKSSHKLFEGDRDYILELINKLYNQKELKIFLLDIFSTIELFDKYKILIEIDELFSFLRYFYSKFRKTEYRKRYLKVKNPEEISSEIFRELFVRKYGCIEHMEELSEFKEELSAHRDFLKIVYLIIISSIRTNNYRFLYTLKLFYPYLEEDESIKTLLNLANYNLSDMITYFSKGSNIQEIQKAILNFKSLLQDTIKAYIINYCLTIKLNSIDINNNLLSRDLNINEKMIWKINIFNRSDFTFKGLECNLSVKPKRRIEITILKEPVQKRLKKRLEWEYELTGRSAGRVSVFVQLVIENPFEENRLFIYKKKIRINRKPFQYKDSEKLQIYKV